MSTSPIDIFTRFAIVLVQPEKSLNIGAVARAMMNLGFHDLRLVDPQEYDPDLAKVTACWATPLLETLQIYPTVADAVADRQELIGFSGRDFVPSPHRITLPQWASSLSDRPATKTALVFGPEDNGLDNTDLALCRYVVRIPSTVENPSFNLAQSVLLALYETARVLTPVSEPDTVPMPTANEYAQLDRLVAAVLTESGFFRDGTPAPVPATVQNIFRRLDLNPQEMGVLLGLFGRVHTALRRARPD